ncbi:hypothetical protein [uncultured Methanospirillum sp.]|nr:hypothetical protein [uncultured Methanospirillum sp.]
MSQTLKTDRGVSLLKHAISYITKGNRKDRRGAERIVHLPEPAVILTGP